MAPPCYQKTADKRHTGKHCREMQLPNHPTTKTGSINTNNASSCTPFGRGLFRLSPVPTGNCAGATMIALRSPRACNSACVQCEAAAVYSLAAHAGRAVTPLHERPVPLNHRSKVLPEAPLFPSKQFISRVPLHGCIPRRSRVVSTLRHGSCALPADHWLRNCSQ
jgi:hypothetical protein